MLFAICLIAGCKSYQSNTKSGQKLQQIVKNLDNGFFKGLCPKNITIKYASLQNHGGWCDPDKNLIVLSDIYLTKNPEQLILQGHQSEEKLLKHEISHLCMFNLTRNNFRNEQFQFLNEGLARVFENDFSYSYKIYSVKIAKKKKLKAGNLSFEKIKKWKTYFGNWQGPNPKYDISAYDAGASFAYFITDTYSKDKLHEFLVNIGKTGNLQQSIFNVFSTTETALQNQWLDYINNFNMGENEPENKRQL